MWVKLHWCYEQYGQTFKVMLATTMCLPKVMLLPRKKPPIIDNRIPTQNDVYDLDDTARLQTLNVHFNSSLKIADEYDHYPHCKWAVIEYKSRSLRDGVEQLESTTKQLAEMQKRVDYAIIVAEKMNSAESSLYTKRSNVLYIRKTRKAVTIPLGNGRIPVNIYEPHEIDEQYQKHKGSLDSWA